MRSSDDSTIFAWKSDVVWYFKGGILARSPSCFVGSGGIICPYGLNSTSFTLTNKGVNIQLQSFHLDDQPGAFLGVLDCHNANDSETSTRDFPAGR